MIRYFLTFHVSSLFLYLSITNNAITGMPILHIKMIGKPKRVLHLICSVEYHFILVSILTLESPSSTFTHWNRLKPDFVKAGCSMNSITIMLTTMLRLMSSKYFLSNNHIDSHMKLYKMISINGNSDIKNILNMVALGANAFISLSCINQSTDTNASDDTPIISAGENRSVKDSG